MAFLDLPPPICWPRMRSGVENPFQNAPGPFIFALPNLAGACPSTSSDTISDCSLACPFAPFDDDRDDDNDDDDDDSEYHPRRQSRCHNPPPPETPRHSPVETAETAGPLSTEDADPEDLPPPVPHSPFDEDEDSDNDSDSDDTSTSTGSSQHPQQQQSASSGSSTPTPSHTPSSPASSESSEDPREDAEDSPPPKEKGRRKRRSGQGARRRRRNRQLLEQNGCVMGPRAMGIPGVQLQGWFQRSSQPPPLLPSAMPGVGHAHVLFPAVYYGSSSPMTWLLLPHAAPPVPGFFG